MKIDAYTETWEEKKIDQLTRLELATIISGIRVQEPVGRAYSMERLLMRRDMVWIQLIQLPEEVLRALLADYMRTHSMTSEFRWIVNLG